MPIPSAPIEWERKILYINPKNFSHTENTVTKATVLKNVFNFHPESNIFIILFTVVVKYNNTVMKKFIYRAIEGDNVLSVSKKFLIPVQNIIYLNNLNAEVEEGDLLYLEKHDYTVYTVKPTDTLEGIAKEFGVDAHKILSINHISYVYMEQLIYLPK